jgi:hypothetical protein
MNVFRPSVYLRVGPSGSGHTQFINGAVMMCGFKLFPAGSGTPLKMFHRNPGKFEEDVGKCKVKKMVAFDNIHLNHGIKSFKSLNGIGLTYTNLNGVDTMCFSVMSSKLSNMKEDNEADAGDVLDFVFGCRELESRHHTMYENVTEIHHLLGNGTVRVLACDKKKLTGTVVVSHEECLDRILTQMENREMSMVWEA